MLRLHCGVHSGGCERNCVCTRYNTRGGGSGGCRVEVGAVVKSEVSPVFDDLFAQIAAGAMRLPGC